MYPRLAFAAMLFMVPARHAAGEPTRVFLKGGTIESALEKPAAIEAARLIDSGDYAGARVKIEKLAGSGVSREGLQRVRFLLGLTLYRLEEWEPAAAALDGLDAAVPVMADRIRFMRGTSLARQGKYDEAAKTLSKVGPGPVYQPALTRLGNCYMELDRFAEAAATYRRAVEVRRSPAAMIRLATALDKAGRRPDAVRILREAYFEFAATGRSSLLKALGDLGVRPKATENETLTRARALLDAHRNDSAFREARSTISSRSPSVRCGSLLIAGKALSKLRRHSEALPYFRKAVDACTGEGDIAYALFNAVRSSNRSGRHDEGDEHAATLAKRFPKSTLNDDVAIWRARRALSDGRTKDANAILVESLDSWPDGDMANESRWLLAWGAIRTGHSAKALALLSGGRKEAGGDVDYGSRFAYWRARVLEKAGDRKGAAKAYSACAREYPMTFYGFMALNRLGRSRAAGVGKHIAGVSEKPPLGPFLTVGDGDVLARGAAARAVWLARTGLAGLAAEEARYSGSTADEDWLISLILDRGGRYTRSHRAAVKALAAVGRFWPDSVTEGYYRLAYPRPYREIVEKAAKESGIDPLLIWAVMRVESAFVPGIESRANAIGLMQLILPTARAMAKRLGIAANERTLRRPEVNVRLGSLYLSRLLKRFGRVLLAIPGYNAGGGAVSRWLKAHKGARLDTFVESIGARETRNYARKVFESYAIYRYLYSAGDRRFVTVKFGL